MQSPSLVCWIPYDTFINSILGLESCGGCCTGQGLCAVIYLMFTGTSCMWSDMSPYASSSCSVCFHLLALRQRGTHSLGAATA